MEKESPHEDLSGKNDPELGQAGGGQQLSSDAFIARLESIGREVDQIMQGLHEEARKRDKSWTAPEFGTGIIF